MALQAFAFVIKEIFGFRFHEFPLTIAYSSQIAFCFNKLESYLSIGDHPETYFESSAFKVHFSPLS